MDFDDFLSSLFRGGDNAPKAAMGNYQQIPGIYKQYLGPYAQAGQQAEGSYQNELQKMMSDPEGYMKNLMAGYHPSQQYQNQVSQATTAANNASAAGGTLGTGVEQNQLASQVNNFANQDQQQYLDNVTGVHNTGLEGMGNIASMGSNAGSLLSQLLGQNEMQQGDLNYQTKEDQDKGIQGITTALAGIL